MPAAVLVPIKDFRQAKQRLAGVLSPYERERLARQMAAHVIAAAAPFPVSVVCDDERVAQFATDHAANVLWCPGLGLNGAISAGIQAIAPTISRVIIAHSDLPLAVTFAELDDTDGVAIVADRHGRGTNVLSLPTSAASFVLHFGSGSFHAHLAEAARHRLRAHRITDDRLAWDVDTPEDFAHPDLKEFLLWLPTNLDNRRSEIRRP